MSEAPSANPDESELKAPLLARVPAARVGGRPIGKIVLEVVLIATGVFLGLAGEQWRENAAYREDARRALQLLRTEILVNQSSVNRVEDYHASTSAVLIWP
jgi:hypothetical protein